MSEYGKPNTKAVEKIERLLVLQCSISGLAKTVNEIIIDEAHSSPTHPLAGNDFVKSAMLEGIDSMTSEADRLLEWLRDREESRSQNLKADCTELDLDVEISPLSEEEKNARCQKALDIMQSYLRKYHRPDADLVFNKIKPTIEQTTEDRIKSIIYNAFRLQHSKDLQFDSPSDIRKTDTLQDTLNGDSVDCMEMVMQLEEEFDITIHDPDTEQFVTVGDVIDFARKHLSEIRSN